MSESDGFSTDQVQYRKMRPSDANADFGCSKSDFEEYFRITSLYDQQEHMGQPYVFVWNGRVVGYVVLAMDHPNEEQGRLGIDTFGKIPALLISHLATDKRYVRRGVGRLMVGWASAYAKFMSGMAGCRVVLVKSEPDVVGFYEKLGFKKTSKARADLTDMYLDIKHLR